MLTETHCNYHAILHCNTPLYYTVLRWITFTHSSVLQTFVDLSTLFPVAVEPELPERGEAGGERNQEGAGDRTEGKVSEFT